MVGFDYTTTDFATLFITCFDNLKKANIYTKYVIPKETAARGSGNERPDWRYLSRLLLLEYLLIVFSIDLILGLMDITVLMWISTTNKPNKWLQLQNWLGLQTWLLSTFRRTRYTCQGDTWLQTQILSIMLIK